MGFSTAAIYAIGTGITVAASYSESQRQAAQQRDQAARESVAERAQAEATRQQAETANARERARAQAAEAEKQAAEQLKENAEVVVAPEEGAQQRRRRVQAEFGTTGPAANTAGSGSIRF